MGKVESRITPDLLQQEVNNYWQTLGPYFPRAKKLNSPKLQIVGVNSPHSIFTDEVVKGRSDGLYIPESHSLMLADRLLSDKSMLDRILTEEVIHAATYMPASLIFVDADVFNDFNRNKNNFGKRIRKLLVSTGLLIIEVDVNEFFPPLAQPLLLGEKHHQPFDWNKLLKLLEKDVSTNLDGVRLVLLKIIGHLPQLAGEIFIKQYDDDLKKLLQEHPEILTLDRFQLWRNYCVPLLT
jgi:hypothetical protein